MDVQMWQKTGAVLAYEPGADNAVLRVNRSPAFEFGNGRDEGRELAGGINQETTAVMQQARAVVEGRLDAARATTGYWRHSAGLEIDQPLGEGVTLHAWGGYILQEGWARWDSSRQQLEHSVQEGQGGLVGHVDLVAGEKHTGVAVGMNAVQEPQQWGVLRHAAGPRALQASDPLQTRELLRDINRALNSPLPMTGAAYVRKLEAELAAGGTPGSTARYGSSSGGAFGGGGSGATMSAAEHSAKDLVASLERMLQQPAAAQPGRAAISALRQSQTAEVGAAGGSGGGTSSLARTSSSSFGRTASGLAFRSTTLSTEGGAFGTAPAAAGAAPSRWRLVADRAASFKPPRPSSGGGLGGWGGSGVWAGGDAAGSSSMQASPAADLLAEIDRVVSPTASPAASPSFSYLAPAHGSPTACAATLPFASLASPAASPAAAPLARLPPPAWQAAAQQQAQQLLALQAAEQAHQAQQQVQQQQECTPPGRPAAAGAAASRWNAVAAGPAACSSPGAASPVTTFGFAAPSPSPAAPLGLSSGGEVSVERVELPVQRFRLGAAPGGTRFDAEAAAVLGELARFGELERRCTALFNSQLEAALAAVYALPQGVAAAAAARAAGGSAAHS
ncbi:hypothetical protein C2E20_7297 [Micractinium conductrix]|uniref:Uncharacterized protein n=1 Tax=Micractinium conductrix TaxID=554055 RepID=A0A2P6V4S1_9CHLO|nr:hypothetical protein C2E20_7297 [Micractinium conductrix]|eukprot:PSC69093.1 hypothetical protein C2E20_7297 [Micractinium conductrix]